MGVFSGSKPNGSSVSAILCYLRCPTGSSLSRLLPFYIFFFALCLRLTFLAVTYHGKEGVESHEDVGIAIHLLEGKGFAYGFHPEALRVVIDVRATAMKPPPYPLLIASVFFIFGAKNFAILFVVHALLSALTCLLFFLSVRKLSYSTAIIGSFALSVYPPFIYHSITMPESTTLILFLIAVFFYNLININEGFSWKKWIVTSLTAGVLAMTEPVTIPFIFCTFCYIAYVTTADFRLMLARLFIALSIFSATILPWTIRNYITFNQFVFIKDSFGWSLMDNLYHSGVELPDSVRLSLEKELYKMDEPSGDRLIMQAVMNFIAENPTLYLQLLMKHFINFWWQTDRYKNNFSKKYLFGRRLPYILLLLFSTPAMLWRLAQLSTLSRKIIKENLYQNIILMLVLTYTATYTIVGAMNLRWHFPVELVMFIFLGETFQYITANFVHASRTPAI
jgi:4-amino-4-deoxy-L-arabinose transferase-like glycosyltransferase